MAEKRNCVSIILAAGASTRMKSKKSKLLHPILGRPIIQWALEQVRTISKHAIVVVGHQREELEKVAKEVCPAGLKLTFVVQKEQRGTADAVRVALSALDNQRQNETDLFVMAGDAVLLKPETLRAFREDFVVRRGQLAFMTTHISFANSYGRVVRDHHGRVERIVEAREATPEQLALTEINTGFYLGSLKAFREGIAQVSNRNKTKEFYLTDLIEIANEKDWLLLTTVIEPNEALGVNNRADLALAARVMQGRINEYWMKEGVTLVDPATTWIEPTVTFETDVTVEGGVILRGQTQIGEDSTIGAHSIIEDTVIGKSCRVDPFTHG